MEFTDIEKMTWLTKKEFMERYANSDTTYWRRMTELKKSPYKRAYVTPTEGEVWIVEEIYKLFLVWLSDKKHKLEVTS